jgi:hypothetical protein
MKGKDALADWVRDEVPEDFFETVEDAEVEKEYGKVVAWVEGHAQYSRAAKQKFLGGADPWLIAVAMAKEKILVSYEVSQPMSKAMIKLPDVASNFNVKCIPPYVMLRELGVVLTLE